MRLDDIMVTEDKIDLLEYKFSDFFLIENIQSKYSKMNSSFRKKNLTKALKEVSKMKQLFIVGKM